MSINLQATTDRDEAGMLPVEIDEGTRLVLLAYLEAVDVKSGAVFFQQGKTNDRLWFLVKGTATVERTWRGRPMPVANLSAPGIFGATTFFRPTAATVTVRASSDARLLTLDHAAYERLRADHPRAAEALALATVRVLAERFDMLDQRMTDFMNAQQKDHEQTNEWAKFRSRLFEQPNII